MTKFQILTLRIIRRGSKEDGFHLICIMYVYISSLETKEKAEIPVELVFKICLVIFVALFFGKGTAASLKRANFLFYCALFTIEVR